MAQTDRNKMIGIRKKWATLHGCTSSYEIIRLESCGLPERGQAALTYLLGGLIVPETFGEVSLESDHIAPEIIDGCDGDNLASKIAQFLV